MNTKTKALLVSILCVGGISASHAAEFDDFARVISVTPQVEQINQPKQECWTENVPVQRQQRGVGGSILGGLAGGIIGNQVGGGNGRTAATAVGAITGAIVGDRIENNGNNTVVSDEPVRQCRTVDRWVSRNSGYAVTYDYRGHTYTSILPYEPGNRIKLHVSLTPEP